MTKRLFTFGCSFTYYVWPSWSDFLGIEYDHYENWGMSGIGCRAIAERVADCHARNKFNKDDIVIVQWTTHLRHDFYNPKKIDNFRNLPWKTYGSLFNYHNIKLYDKKWFDTFFYEPAYVYHSLNSILMIQSLLESTQCTWYMTSIGDWPKLSSDLDDITGTSEKRLDKEISIKTDMPELTYYIKPIWEDKKDRWLEPIGTYASKQQENYWWFKLGKDLIREQHPSPRQHLNWLNDILRPKLTSTNKPSEQQLWIEQIEKIKEECSTDRQKLEHKLFNDRNDFNFWPNKEIWPTSYKGF